MVLGYLIVITISTKIKLINGKPNAQSVMPRLCSLIFSFSHWLYYHKSDLYLSHIAEMLDLLELDLGVKSSNAAEKVYDLEVKLATSHMTKTENRDPHSTYNISSIIDLKEKCENKFDFGEFLFAATNKTQSELGNINVRNTKALKTCAFGAMAKEFKDYFDMTDAEQASALIVDSTVIAGFIAALIAGYFACKWMIEIVKKSKLSYFAYYCWAVGITGIGYSLFFV